MVKRDFDACRKQNARSLPGNSARLARRGYTVVLFQNESVEPDPPVKKRGGNETEKWANGGRVTTVRARRGDKGAETSKEMRVERDEAGTEGRTREEGMESNLLNVATKWNGN